MIKLISDMRFSPGTPISTTNKTDLHDIAEILVKVALNSITLTPQKTQDPLVGKFSKDL